ncbi:hypothetical protein [Mycobacterium uberis]|uniref:hypothetical protein n=1 Tax=Mycobacterium uberis TaxID=2162698 RepID=UPI001FB30358|nr:hypothetical protein [Mycobacterium uberis]
MSPLLGVARRSTRTGLQQLNNLSESWCFDLDASVVLKAVEVGPLPISSPDHPLQRVVCSAVAAWLRSVVRERRLDQLYSS